MSSNSIDFLVGKLILADLGSYSVSGRLKDCGQPPGDQGHQRAGRQEAEMIEPEASDSTD